ncbi:MAG: hypothetical protein CMJ31_06775 [Phycisphaerae bacterium]|nr:hypothetical protein [Phycisphaerae bacterium]
MPTNRCLFLAFGAIIAATSALTAGCGGFGALGGRSTQLDSAQFPVRLKPNFTTRVYTPISENEADVYLTDLPESAFDDPNELSRSSGQLVHVHMFLRPRAGRTPVDTTACTATVRYIVLAEGRVGVYTGGGFLFPRGAPGGKHFAATMADGALRLYAKGPGFVDRVGSGEFDISFRARNDERVSELLQRTADRLSLSADPVVLDQTRFELTDEEIETPEGE